MDQLPRTVPGEVGALDGVEQQQEPGGVGQPDQEVSSDEHGLDQEGSGEEQHQLLGKQHKVVETPTEQPLPVAQGTQELAVRVEGHVPVEEVQGVKELAEEWVHRDVQHHGGWRRAREQVDGKGCP